MQVAAGQAAPQERSALRHMFSVYEHGHSELAAFVDAMSAHRREQHRLCIGPQFTATGLSRPPAACTVFSGFTYMEDPFEVCHLRCVSPAPGSTSLRCSSSTLLYGSVPSYEAEAVLLRGVEATAV